MFRDETSAPDSVCAALVQHGYSVFQRAFGSDAWRQVVRVKPALVILALGAAPLDECSSLAYLRARTRQLPILVVSPCSTAHRVQCLAGGADDILDQPVVPQELVARTQAVLRRYLPGSSVPDSFLLGATRVELQQQRAVGMDREHRLTEAECLILGLLAQHPGHPIAREQLAQVIRGPIAPTRSRSLETHIWRLRKKLGDHGRQPRWLRNIPGIGYQLDGLTA